MEIKLTILLTADPALLAAIVGFRAGVAPVVEMPKAKLKAGPVLQASKDNGQPAAAEASAPTATSTSAHTLETLRAIAVPKSKAGHKDTIKKWLSEAGYPSLQDLGEKDFDAFHAFIDKL